MPEKRQPAATYRYRSAVTGRYVTAAYARRYPHRTVRERVGYAPVADWRAFRGSCS